MRLTCYMLDAFAFSHAHGPCLTAKAISFAPARPASTWPARRAVSRRSSCGLAGTSVARHHWQTKLTMSLAFWKSGGSEKLKTPTAMSCPADSTVLPGAEQEENPPLFAVRMHESGIAVR